MPAWPSSLPQQQFKGLTVRRQTSSVSFEPDSGPAKKRRRGAARRDVVTPISLTGTQYQTFEAFFATTLQEGSLEFDWTDPVTDSTVSFQFLSPPEFTLFVGGTVAARRWLSTLELRITTIWP